MSTSLPRSVFPLVLTPMELYYLAEDRDPYPMAFPIRLDLTGVIDRGAFEQAVAAALQRHPLLHALLKRAKRKKLCWVGAGDRRPVIDWASADVPVRCVPSERIDLTRETGLRIWVRQAESTATVTLQFHHSCADGIAAYRFIGDVLALYGLAVGGPDEPPRLEELDPARLRNRILRQVDYWATGQRWELAKRGLKQFWSLFHNRPRRLTSHHPPTTPPDFPGFQTISLPHEVYEALRSVARSAGATLNDLLLAVLFQTVHTWIFAEKKPGGRDYLRIFVPTDLRAAEDFAMPAACVTSFEFVSRPARQCRDWSEILPTVREEMLAIRTQRAGIAFADTVALANMFWGLLPLLAKAPVCLATTGLSNIGDPTRRFTAILPRRKGSIVAGNLVLDDVTGTPPLRRKAYGTFSIFSYRRKLTICLRCEQPPLSADDTTRFLNLYGEQLQAVAATVMTPVAT